MEKNKINKKGRDKEEEETLFLIEEEVDENIVKVEDYTDHDYEFELDEKYEYEEFIYKCVQNMKRYIKFHVLPIGDQLTTEHVHSFFQYIGNDR